MPYEQRHLAAAERMSASLITKLLGLNVLKTFCVAIVVVQVSQLWTLVSLE